LNILKDVFFLYLRRERSFERNEFKTNTACTALRINVGSPVPGTHEGYSIKP
jgi:hypothetical protein